jgi:hypothetical protein
MIRKVIAVVALLMASSVFVLATPQDAKAFGWRNNYTSSYYYTPYTTGYYYPGPVYYGSGYYSPSYYPSYYYSPPVYSGSYYYAPNYSYYAPAYSYRPYYYGW